MRTGLIILTALVLLGSERAQALETYCLLVGGGRVYNGGEFHREWKVVHPSARRVQLPGRTKPTTSCNVDFSSVGEMYRPIEIIKPPKNGTAQVLRTYRISYVPSKLGPDELSIRFHWVAAGGALQSAIVHYRIQVIDTPM